MNTNIEAYNGGFGMRSEDRIKYAKRALVGTALGDCFGQTFFIPDENGLPKDKKQRDFGRAMAFYG